MRDGATAAVGSKRCHWPSSRASAQCVRVGLAHDHVVAARIHASALVARDDARGNAGGAQHQHERARVVLAETAPPVEHEAVDRVALVERRRQRIDVFLVVEFAQQCADEGAIVRLLLAQVARELDACADCPRRCRGWTRLPPSRSRDTTSAAPTAACTGSSAIIGMPHDDLLVARHARAEAGVADRSASCERCRTRGQVEREQRAPVVGLERDGVGDARGLRSAPRSSRSSTGRATRCGRRTARTRGRASSARLLGGGGPSNSTRNATASSSERSLMSPGDIESDRPVRAAVSVGRLHSGEARRGNSTNSSTAIGRPCRIMTRAAPHRDAAARTSASRRRGRATARRARRRRA